MVKVGIERSKVCSQISAALLSEDQRLRLPRFLDDIQEKDPEATKQVLLPQFALSGIRPPSSAENVEIHLGMVLSFNNSFFASCWLYTYIALMENNFNISIATPFLA